MKTEYTTKEIIDYLWQAVIAGPMTQTVKDTDKGDCLAVEVIEYQYHSDIKMTVTDGKGNKRVWARGLPDSKGDLADLLIEFLGEDYIDMEITASGLPQEYEEGDEYTTFGSG